MSQLTPVTSEQILNTDGQFYRREDVDSYVKQLEDRIATLEDRCRWHDYPKEKPTKSDRYLVEYLNPEEGDAYLTMECDYLIGEGYTGWCTEEKVVSWLQLP